MSLLGICLGRLCDVDQFHPGCSYRPVKLAQWDGNVQKSLPRKRTNWGGSVRNKPQSWREELPSIMGHNSKRGPVDVTLLHSSARTTEGRNIDESCRYMYWTDER